MNNIIRSTAGVVAVGIMAAACTTAPPPQQAASTPEIDNAAQVVNRAAANQHVMKYAPTEMERAQNSLQHAQTTWKNSGDAIAASHFAYLAHQRALTAMELANQRAAEDTIKIAATQRDRMVSSASSPQVTAEVKMTKSDQQLQQELAGLPTQATARGLTVTLPEARFAFNEAELPQNTMPSVDHLANVLKNNPERKVAVEGYTDTQGSDDYNMTLAQERANAVRDALVSRGIDANRIVIRSYGEAHPVANNDTRDGRHQNRRAEIVLSDVQGHVPEPITSSSGQ